LPSCRNFFDKFPQMASKARLALVAASAAFAFRIAGQSFVSIGAVPGIAGASGRVVPKIAGAPQRVLNSRIDATRSAHTSILSTGLSGATMLILGAAVMLPSALKKRTSGRAANVVAVRRNARGSTDPITRGEEVPSVTFMTRVRTGASGDNAFDWKPVTSSDLFKGKRIALFALPGAFTPTCSSTHLPGYEQQYDKIIAQGVDEVYCLSVNDAFVMRQWGLKQGLEEDMTLGANGFKKVKLIPDGACLFTRGMGMSCIWDSERGFGERAWRYSCIINDMKVEKMFEEPNRFQNSGPDPFGVSDANTMLTYLETTRA